MLHPGHFQDLQAPANGTAGMKFGPPFKSQFAAKRRGMGYTFSLATIDVGGNAVDSISGPRYKRPAPPELALRQNGQVIKNDKFQYR